jgi:predicted N-formylglutamate amidohydrolase
MLHTHRAFDRGALELARALAASLKAPLVEGRATRLLVDLNRPLHHPRVFSKFTRGLDAEEKRHIVDEFHAPHWARVAGLVESALNNGHAVLHVSVHSFTPRLGPERRTADIGLLYDPSRPLEAEVAISWQRYLREDNRALRVRRNYPYRGAASGLTASLRKQLDSEQYLGLELEVNQALVAKKHWPTPMSAAITSSVRAAARRI